jgi:hypothetical protein
MINNSGLNPTPIDYNDYSLPKTFGQAILSLPAEYIVIPERIMDQSGSDFCGAFSSTAVSESMDMQYLSPEFLFAKMKQITGDIYGYGGDLRSFCKAWIKYGTIKQSDAPFSLNDKDRNFLADYKNWPSELDMKAAEFKKESFFRVEKIQGLDLFDSIRQALFNNAIPKRTIFTGAMWYNDWTFAENGIIPTEYSEAAGLHAFRIIGWKNEYLIIQNSYSSRIGNDGLFYMHRQTVNKELTEPCYMFIDLGDIVPKPIGNFLQLLFQKLLNIL